MKLFVKFGELPDETLITLYNATVDITNFYHEYFAKIGIPLNEVQWGRPEEYEAVVELRCQISRVLSNRKIID